MIYMFFGPSYQNYEHCVKYFSIEAVSLKLYVTYVCLIIGPDVLSIHAKEETGDYGRTMFIMILTHSWKWRYHLPEANVNEPTPCYNEVDAYKSYKCINEKTFLKKYIFQCF